MGRHRALSCLSAPAACSSSFIDTWWSDLCAPHDELRLQVSSDGTSLNRRSPAPAAALADSPLKQGAHEITLAIRGEALIVGVAEAEMLPSLSYPWRHRAWGFCAWNRRLISCPAAFDANSVVVQSPGARQLPVPAASDEEVHVHLRIDTVRSQVLFVWDGKRLGVSNVGTVLRPWALFLSRGGIADASSDASAEGVRIIAHTYSQVPTFYVEGLTPLVNQLPIVKQALALAWCEGRGIEDIHDLTRDATATLVDELNLPDEQSCELMQRLDSKA